MPHPDVIFDVTLPASSTGGTIATNKANAIKNENVKLTFTPATGNFLTAASWNDGTSDHDISPASPTDAAYSSTITMPEQDITVTATFTPAVASITSGGTTTYYLTLQDAFDAIANNETIEILSDITEATAGKEYTSDHNHTINLNGYNVIFDSHSALGSLTINGPGTLTCKTLDNPSAGNTHTLTINGATVVCNGVAGDPPTTSIQWMADHIVLTGGADLTAKNLVYLGGGDGEFTFTIEDNASIAHLVNCKINGYDTNKAHIVQLRKYVNPNDRSYYDTQTSAHAAVTVDLRQSWGIELKNGLSNATATFYDGGTSFDPTAFSPSAYTTSTLYVDNSNGNDHYVIAHIEPADGYWTDEKLLSHTESGASITGTPVSDLKMVKREGKTFVEINDYPQLRRLIAQLLAEIQRIKSEGDLEAARVMVERYAVKVDPELHEEVLARYKRLNLAPYKGFINPMLLPVYDTAGEICDIQVNYSESYAHQMLRYSAEYGTLI